MSLAISRPKRQVKRLTISNDFVDDIDAELEAIESSAPPVMRPTATLNPAGEQQAPRKRGRPRKYPLAPPPQDAQPLKRPRGRPKGSGKHQRAAAAAAAVTALAQATSTLPGPTTESALTTGNASVAPSASLTIGGNSNGAPPPIYDTPPLFQHPSILPQSTTAKIMRPETTATHAAAGTITPHYPPMNGRTSPEGSNTMHNTVVMHVNGGASSALGEPVMYCDSKTPGGLAPTVAATPTPARPRNRRKGALPTKTE